MAAEAIASNSVLSTYSIVAKAQDVFDIFCGAKSDIIARAEAERAAHNVSSLTVSRAHDQAVFAIS